MVNDKPSLMAGRTTSSNIRESLNTGLTNLGMSRNLLQLPMLLFSSMMALKLVSDVSSNCCNILSNNPTEFSSFDCSPLCHYIILISFLADLCLGHICSCLCFNLVFIIFFQKLDWKFYVLMSEMLYSRKT